MKPTLTLLVSLTLSSARLCADVLPPDAVVEGRTIGEWSGEFFKWLYSIPTNQHPVFDDDGSLAVAHQPEGNVFFLTAVYGFSGTATRRFTIPEDTYLFLPVLAVDFENINTVPPCTVEQLRDKARHLIDTIAEMHASIDGEPVVNLPEHRAVSPVFSLEFATADNLKTYAYRQPIVGTIDPVVGDGIWLMVEPLSPGEHVINFGGYFTGFETFRTDITDHITVVPIPLADRVRRLIAMVEESNLSPQHQPPLLGTLSAAQTSFQRGNTVAAINQLRAFQQKVRGRIARNELPLAEELIRAAQQIIEKAETE